MNKLIEIIIRGVQYAEPGYKTTGIFAFIGFPLFYFIWSSRGMYESAVFRGICTLISLGLALCDYWPERYKKFLPWNWYIFLVVCGPALFLFHTMKNDFNLVWTGSLICVIYLVNLLIDWKNFLIIITTGSLLGVFLFFAAGNEFTNPKNLFDLFMVFSFAILSSTMLNFRHYALKMEKSQTMRLLGAKLSHEIKTPLSGIRIVIQSLLNNIDELPHNQHEVTEPLRENVLTIKEYTEQSQKLIDIILTNAGRKKLASEELITLNIGDIVDYAIRMFPITDNRQFDIIHVDIKDNFTFKGAEPLFLNVIYNLLKNSFYAIAGRGEGEIYITTELNKRKRPVLRFRDTGPGMPRERLKKVLDEYHIYQGAESGIGLGLPFVNTTMEQVGGKMEITSVEGEYTEITLYFPIIVE